MTLTMLDDYFNPAFWCVASCCIGWVVSTIGTAVFAVLGMFICMYIFLMAPVIFPVATMVALLLIALIFYYRDHHRERTIIVNPDPTIGSAIPGQPNGEMIMPVVREPPRIALHQAAIASLQTFGYEKQEMTESMQCTICLTAFEEGEQVKQLPRCLHLYHPTCIDQWLRRNYTCPICRDSARKDATEELIIIVD